MLNPSEELVREDRIHRPASRAVDPYTFRLVLLHLGSAEHPAGSPHVTLVRLDGREDGARPTG